MFRPRRACPVALLALLALAPAPPAGAAGARLFKSGPIQVTADGSAVWIANADNDSVSRLDTRSLAVEEFVLPGTGGRHSPRGLSVLEDGSEVWVACHDEDAVHVLRGVDGAQSARIDLPWGSGPYSVALSRDGSRALVTLHRSDALAVLDRASRAVTHVLKPVFISPLGAAWMEDGQSAWVTHLFADGEDPFLTRVDFSGAEPRVTSRIIVKSTNPKQSSGLAAPYRIAEGGYLTFRGHLAQVPAVSGRNELWLPTQYNNINEDVFSPDSTVQTTIRRLRLATRTIPNSNADKVVLTAVHVHDPQGSAYVGPGWDARISGPVDIAFSADGATAYLVGEQSNDLLIFPTATPAVRPAAAPPLTEVACGDRPMGVAISPVADLAFVANSLSRDVSVIDLAARAEVHRLPLTPRTGEPLAAAVLRGAKLFHGSTDPRVSGNQKVACASCHPHGEHDGRHWDFQHLPGRHGPRSSMSLLGLYRTFGAPDPVTGWGQLHRSGDRDELQDFEHNFQGPLMGGTGFLGSAVQPERGAPNAGLDPDLDAIAEYILSLEPLRRSPHRLPDGSLSEAAIRGATFFLGANRAAKAGDAGCAACHVPETGFADFSFHDVGQRRDGSEQELNARAPAWHVNTPTLVGVWHSPPYDGVSGYTSTITGVLKDAVARARTGTPHGRPDGLTGRQLADLAAFVLSIDGELTAAEVRGARDVTPPRMVRAEPASLTTVDVWFNETVDRASAEDEANWRLETTGGVPVPVIAVVRDAKNGDRVTLTVALEAGRTPVLYTVSAAGPIRDAADAATGGVANALDPADPANRISFALGASLTVTLGASGYENITIAVHDAAMVGPGLDTWSHDSPWLFPLDGGGANTGFVRFDWRARFAQVTGLGSAADLLEASFSLHPDFGDAQRIEVRRTLKKWSDPATGSDWNSNPTGGPSWRDHSHPASRWNRPGAAALGGTGGSPADYDASFDLSASVDATTLMSAINERCEFRSEGITAAYRFWFENPTRDYGHALRVAAGATQATKFERAESELGELGPVLTITYRLPVAASVAFHRGDPDGSGGTDLSDAVFIFNHLFLAGDPPACAESADSQNDGYLDISDGIHILLHLFAGGLPPAAPGPVGSPCGSDPDPQGSSGDLGCTSYPPCGA
jgi:DNA-binding beta-propeller fold protein YncE